MSRPPIPMPPRDPCVGMTPEQAYRRHVQQRNDYMAAWQADQGARKVEEFWIGAKWGVALGLLLIIAMCCGLFQ